MDEYNFTQARNGWVIRKGAMPGMYNDQVWVFNSSEEMGKWVTENFKPADSAPPASERGDTK